MPQHVVHRLELVFPEPGQHHMAGDPRQQQLGNREEAQTVLVAAFLVRRRIPLDARLDPSDIGRRQDQQERHRRGGADRYTDVG